MIDQMIIVFVTKIIHGSAMANLEIPLISYYAFLYKEKKIWYQYYIINKL